MISTHLRIKIIASTLLSAVWFFSCARAADARPELFWRSKPKSMAQIIDERAIVVSVKSTPSTQNKKKLIMVGGGMVNSSNETAFLGAKNYEQLREVSEYIREVKFNSKEDTLFMHTEAFQYHARMTMRVTGDESDKNFIRLKFIVIEGNFKGMHGEFSFEKYKPNKTLMGYFAEYEYVKLPMPQFFVEFGLEFVLKRVAQKMRTVLEKNSAL